MNPALARLSPAMLSQYLHPGRKIPKHVQYMSDRIRAHILRQDGASGRLIICMPPGHVKSDTASVHTPLWVLELLPQTPIALVSYSHEKALEWGARVRDDILEHPEFFVTRLKPDSRAKSRWHTVEGGGMYCVGIGGGLTGFRAGLLIIDDPVKDAAEADSLTYRNRTWEWFRKVARTRCFPSATIIVVETRWNEDDLAGRILHQMEVARKNGDPHDEWELISFPCEAEENDILGRKPGEPLWPEAGYDAEWMAKEKFAQGSYSWSALYQQQPAPATGSVFRRQHFRYFEEEETCFILHRPDQDPKIVLKSECTAFQTIDTAQKAKSLNDWTTCITFISTPDSDLLVYHVAREKLEVPDQLPWILAQRNRYPGLQYQAVEDKASGIGLIQEAARRGTPFRILSPHGVNKTFRARQDPVGDVMSAVVRYENGTIYHLSGAPWLNDFEAELLSFPKGKNDDQVDCISYGALQASTPGPRIRTL